MSAGTMASGPLAALARGVAIAGCVSPAEAGRRRGEEGGRSSTSGTARGGGRRGEPQLMKKHLEGFLRGWRATKLAPRRRFLRCVGRLRSAAAKSHRRSPLCRMALRPNILFILADDLGWAEVGYHSKHHVRGTGDWRGRRGASLTPAIDQLAAEGVQLERHYCHKVAATPHSRFAHTRTTRVLRNGLSLTPPACVRSSARRHARLFKVAERPFT